MSQPAPANTLTRQLGLWSAIAVLVGSTIGSGIFRSPAGITARLPGPLPLMSVWVAGGLFALCGALTLAELSGALPARGAISTTFSEYFLRVLGFDPSVAPYSDWVHWVAAVAIALTATFNYVGVRT